MRCSSDILHGRLARDVRDRFAKRSDAAADDDESEVPLTADAADQQAPGAQALRAPSSPWEGHGGGGGKDGQADDVAGPSRDWSVDEPDSPRATVTPPPREATAADTVGWPVLLRVLRNPIVVYAGAWRVLHDLGGYALIMFTPLIIHDLLRGPDTHATDAAAAAGISAAAVGHGTLDASTPPLGGAVAEPPACPGWAGGDHGSDHSGGTGAVTVLLTAVPFGCASMVHLLNSLHAQKVRVIAPVAAAGPCPVS